jgi:uncharacterized delta-60 repeat protein
MIPGRAYASDGDLDITFGNGGKVTTDFSASYDYANTVAIQSDGKIVAAGQISRRGVFALARYTSDGSLDVAFGTGGKVDTKFNEGFPEWVTSLAIQSDGKILAAGQSYDRSEWYYGLLARYNSDGSLDSTFAIGGKVISDFFSEAIAVQSDGKIIAAGYDYSAVGFALARYNSDGSLDSTFGRSGIVTTKFTGYPGADVAALAIQSDGRLVVAGNTWGIAGTTYRPEFALARYNSDGSLDATFGLAGIVTTKFGGYESASAVDLAIQSDGKIVAAGTASSIFEGSDFMLARYNSDGSLDTTFGFGGKAATDISDVDATGGLAIQFDGKIVVAGRARFIRAGTNYDYDFALVRYNVDGSLDAALGLGGNVITDISPSDSVGAVTIQSNGKIVVAGGSAGDFALARYQSTPPPITSLAFTPSVVRSGNSFTAEFSGTDLTGETYFDVRFRSPGSSTDQIVLNWQRGVFGRHTVPMATPSGIWTVTGVRAHREVNDHTADFVSVSTPLTVEVGS